MRRMLSCHWPADVPSTESGKQKVYSPSPSPAAVAAAAAAAAECALSSVPSSRQYKYGSNRLSVQRAVGTPTAPTIDQWWEHLSSSPSPPPSPAAAAAVSPPPLLLFLLASLYWKSGCERTLVAWITNYRLELYSNYGSINCADREAGEDAGWGVLHLPTVLDYLTVAWGLYCTVVCVCNNDSCMARLVVLHTIQENISEPKNY